MTKVIERNTTIPARRTEVFTTAEDNQSAVDVVVLQGERERAADNRVLGPVPAGGHPAGAAGRAADRGHLRHRRQRHPHVSAQDKDTGAEQRITISETSNLDKAEVERMVADAERHRGEDARLRQEVDARNELDAVAYQVERRLAELGDRVPVHERARAEMLVADARQAVKEEAPLDRLRSLTTELQQVYHGLGAAPPGRRRRRPRTGRAGHGGDDDVIDADFTVS